MKYSLLIICSLIFVNHASAETDNWSSFRNGGASITTVPLPLNWSEKTNIAWEQETSGYGQSTPIVHGDTVFITSVIGPMKEECAISAISLETGELHWEHKFDAASQASSDYMHSRAAPTPMVDEMAIYAFFESGDMVALSHAGNLFWKRNFIKDFGPLENGHGIGCSPTQTKGQVIVNVEHGGPSYLIALDKQTGCTNWYTQRKSSKSWTSPIIVENNSQKQIVISSNGTIDAYLAKNGEKAWSIDSLEGNTVPSPTAIDNYLFVGARVPEFGSDQEATKSNLCIKLKEHSGKPTILWRSSKAVSDYMSPVVNGDCVYYLNKVGILFCHDKETGKLHYQKRLEATCWATPIVSENRIYFFGKFGECKVIEQGPQFNLLADNKLWDPLNPPQPVSYREHQAASPHHGGASGKKSGGMVAGLLAKYDSDKDGQLAKAELPAEMNGMFARVDHNKDDLLDQKEMDAMQESFRKRRAGSRESSRDPIVYGVAASNGYLLIRTGTHLYCIGEKNEADPQSSLSLRSSADE